MNAIERRRRLDEYKNGFHYPHEYTDDEIKAIASEARAKALDEAVSAIKKYVAKERRKSGSWHLTPDGCVVEFTKAILALKEKTP